MQNSKVKQVANPIMFRAHAQAQAQYTYPSARRQRAWVSVTRANAIVEKLWNNVICLDLSYRLVLFLCLCLSFCLFRSLSLELFFSSSSSSPLLPLPLPLPSFYLFYFYRWLFTFSYRTDCLTAVIRCIMFFTHSGCASGWVRVVGRSRLHNFGDVQPERLTDTRKTNTPKEKVALKT